MAVKPGHRSQASVVLPDPNTTNPTVPYLQITNPSLSFDRNGNFYVLLDEHNAGGTSGAIVLEKYSFTGDAPVAVRFQQPSGGSSAYNIIYQWLPPGDQAFEPTMAVDSNIASFTDPDDGSGSDRYRCGQCLCCVGDWNCCAGIASPAVAVFQPEYDHDGHFDEWRAGFQCSRADQHQQVRPNHGAGCTAGDHDQSRTIA